MFLDMLQSERGDGQKTIGQVSDKSTNEKRLKQTPNPNMGYVCALISMYE